jgi:4-amino-4-deoxy-L-arabinose transferase-like glycosyltransferase
LVESHYARLAGYINSREPLHGRLPADVFWSHPHQHLWTAHIQQSGLISLGATAVNAHKGFSGSRGGWSAVAAGAAWSIWLAAAFWLTWPGFLWEIEYFRSPGRLFFRLLIASLVFFPFAIWAYQRLRRVGWWTGEFAIIVSIPVAAAFLYEARAAAVTLAVVGASFVIGRRLRGRLAIPVEGAVEDITISSGLGLGLLHCQLFALGIVGWYTVPAFLTCILLCLLLGRREIHAFWTAFGQLHRAWASTTEWRGWAGALVAVFGTAFVTFSVMVIFAPSLAYDVLRVHLPLVHYYAAQHALRTPEYLSYGYFPQGVETLMTMGYVLAGDAAAQMLPPVYFALAMLMAYRIGRMCGLGQFAALTGTMFAVATPLLHWTGSVAKNDLALAFFLLAALHGYLRWRESSDFRSILAGAFFLAMGAGVKHSVVYAVPPLAVLYAYAAMRQPRPVRALAKLAAIFLVFGTFWLGRTWLLMGNPAYPFSPEAAVSARNATHWWNLAIRSLRLPWDVHFNGRRYFESPLDQPMGIALVLFVPAWALARRKLSHAEGACLFFCALYLAYWAVVQGQPRFAIAPILILQVLTAGRVILSCRAMPSAVRFSLYLASAYALLFGLLGTAILEVNAPQLRYLAGRMDKTEYLREALMPYRAVEFVRGVAAPQDPILSVDACPLLYVPNPSLFNCVWTSDRVREKLDVQLQRRNYRFLILPVIGAGEVPAGWQSAYRDESYLVYARETP